MTLSPVLVALFIGTCISVLLACAAVEFVTAQTLIKNHKKVTEKQLHRD